MDKLYAFENLQRHPLHKLACTLLIISSIPACISEIKNTHIIDDSRPMIIFERFGFSKYGGADVSVRNISTKSRIHKAQLNSSSMGFFIVSDVLYPMILNEFEYTKGFCVLSSPYAKPILTFENLKRDSTFSGSVDIDDPSAYSLIFGNCQPEFRVSMYVHTEMYNLRLGEKDFLPAGETNLPKLYFLFFLIYAGFFAIWVFICIKQRLTVDKIHLIMGALLLFKALKMICASEDKTYVRKTGTPHGWDIAFYIFGFFKGIMLFTVIVLIGTGWSFVKPYLQEREKKVLMTVIPLQVLENIAYVVIEETGPATKDWMTWNQIFLLIDFVCCCAVFFPIVWSVKSLREASKSDGKAARNLEKLTLFKQFYVVLMGYLYFTRVVVSAIGTIISYRYDWVINSAAEVASLAFYVFIFFNFQPTEKNPYLVIDDEDESFAGDILEAGDSFEL